MLTCALRRGAPYLLFAALVCVFLWKPIFTGKALLPGDYLALMHPWKAVITPPKGDLQWNPMHWDAIAQFYPWRVYYARSIRAGRLPFWNPHQFCGTPFLANGQSAVLYPFNLLYVFLDPIDATTAYAALHLFLAMAFMYMLLRQLERSAAASVLGAAAFAFSAFMVLWLELPTFVGAAVWLPLVLLLILKAEESRSALHSACAGAALALSFLAGHFQIAFYVLGAAALWWVWQAARARRRGNTVPAGPRLIGLIGLFLVAFVFISAPQVLPTVELARNSHRVRERTPEGYARFVSNALPVYRLVTALVPDYYGNPSRNNYFLLGNLDGHVGSAADYMEYGMYAGVLPLILAAIGLGTIRRTPNAGFFALLAALALLTATGTAINYIFYYAVPGFSALGGPNRILLLYLFGLAGLASFGLDALAGIRNPDPTVRAKGKGWIAPLVVLFALVSGAAAASLGDLPETAAAGLRSLAALLFASGLLVIARARMHACRGSFPALAVGLAAVDLFAFGINFNPTCERSRVYPRTELTDRLRKVTGSDRIAPINPEWSLFRTPDAVLPPNSAMVYGLYDVGGYDSLYTRDYKDYIDTVQGQDSSPIENGNMVLVKRYVPELARLARYVVTTQRLDGLPGLAKVFEADGVKVYRMANADQIEQRQQRTPAGLFLGLGTMSVAVFGLGLLALNAAIRNRRTSQ